MSLRTSPNWILGLTRAGSGGGSASAASSFSTAMEFEFIGGGDGSASAGARVDLHRETGTEQRSAARTAEERGERARGEPMRRGELPRGGAASGAARAKARTATAGGANGSAAGRSNRRIAREAVGKAIRGRSRRSRSRRGRFYASPSLLRVDDHELGRKGERQNRENANERSSVRRRCSASKLAQRVAMESYPNEFTAHHVPLLFLAGLGPPEALPPDPRDPFDRLVQDLRRLFTSASPRSFALWDTTRGAHHDFRVALVQKVSHFAPAPHRTLTVRSQTVRFPPLKARPTSERPAAPLHSPISPLSPSSPLFPDGIIAPIWIRKHREMVPAVFLLALRLFEFVPPPDAVAGPLEGTHLALREEQERQHDAELVREIVERRRTTVERGIKLAVVLLSSRTLLDSPTLDARLSQIRRQSTLDSRASLFVISPVETIEVQHFITSLRLELWDSVMDYYREHGRRVRRKRARALGGKGGLGEKGWAVRYDYKMGFMAEMRGEIEVSLKCVTTPAILHKRLTRVMHRHYEDSYDTLLDMFAQSTLLAPRTKRWAEAKVLADCLTVKVRIAPYQYSSFGIDGPRADLEILPLSQRVFESGRSALSPHCSLPENERNVGDRRGDIRILVVALETVSSDFSFSI